jgi:hypothetical protein
MHGLFITGILFRHLGEEALRLVLGIVEFGETVGQFPAADKKLETIGNKGVVIIAPGQR